MPAEAFFAPGNDMDPTTGRQPVTTAPSDQLVVRDRPSAIQTARAGKTSHVNGAAVSMGEYMTLGGIIAEVKGIPIYANRVLREIAPALAANARVMNISDYRKAAMTLIHDQTEVLIDNELAFAAAQQSLEDRDKQLADALTTMWRQRQITDYGGSLELARQRAADIAAQNNMSEDLSFEQIVQEKYREYMCQLWAQRKIKPRAQVTQTEMREFYNRHVNDLFTQHAETHFRLIYIDPDAEGGRDKALAKIRKIRQQAEKGDNFESLARKDNDSAALKERGGDVGWIEKDNFAREKVEQAVWATQPGQITPIVEDTGGFYIAQVLASKGGHVEPFETQQVQDEITAIIEKDRRKQLMDNVYELLRREYAVTTDPDMANTALDMAMQAYPRFSASAQ